MTNWKEQFEKWVDLPEHQKKLIINIISSEIIEKLIDEIQIVDSIDEMDKFNHSFLAKEIRQQLRDKWL